MKKPPNKILETFPRVKEFIDTISNLSGSSITLATLWVGELEYWMGQNGRGLEDDERVFRDYFDHLQNKRELATASLKSAKLWCNKYVQWMREEKSIKIIEQLSIKLPKLKQVIRFTPSLEQVRAIQEYCMTSGDVRIPQGAVVSLLPATGMRDGEMCTLLANDWRNNTSDGRVIFVVRNPKNGQDREVPMLNIGKPIFHKYLVEQRPQLPNNKYLFPSPRRATEPVTTQAVESMFRALRETLKIPRLTAHSMRRFFVTHLMDKAIDGAVVAKIIGHTNLSNFFKYYGPSGASLARKMSLADQTDQADQMEEERV